MAPWIATALIFFMAAPSNAQSGNCLTGNLLRVDAAFSRHGAGGTFDYSVQVSNMSNRPVTFRVGFRMTSVVANPALHSQSFTLPPAGSRIIIVGNGRDNALASRIGGGVQLNC